MQAETSARNLCRIFIGGSQDKPKFLASSKGLYTVSCRRLPGAHDKQA